jgi:hypothetical protein
VTLDETDFQLDVRSRNGGVCGRVGILRSRPGRQTGIADLRRPDSHGYRQWALIAVTHAPHPGISDELKGILGNQAAVKAQQEGTLPFPDGTVLAKLAWQHVPLGTFDGIFVSRTPVRLEFMVKDSQKYAATGGWGFGRFIEGKPADEAQHKTCFPCHDAHVKAHDFVFTRFAP